MPDGRGLCIPIPFVAAPALPPPVIIVEHDSFPTVGIIGIAVGVTALLALLLVLFLILSRKSDLKKYYLDPKVLKIHATGSDGVAIATLRGSLKASS